MKKRKILTKEQKAQKKITDAKWRLENKEAQKIYQAKWCLENKAKNKIYQAKWRRENKEALKIWKANWYQDNKEEVKRQNQEWRKANPGYSKEWVSQHDLGYWVVYLIHNFDGLGNIYCGQTKNIYSRMLTHKSDGTLNSDKYELIKQCETLEDALDFESYMHEQGYHGGRRIKSGK